MGGIAGVRYNTTTLINSFYRLWLGLSTTQMTRMRTKMKVKQPALQKEHD